MATRVIVAAKRSSYRRYVEEEQDPRALALLERKDPSVRNWLAAHREHVRTLDAVLRSLERLKVRTVLLERPHAAFETGDAALVVTVGGDGTRLAASHNVGSVPVLGINSAPGHSVGFFCAAHGDNLSQMLEQALDGKLPSVVLTRMSVAVNGRIRSRRVLNEALYSHSSPAATSRYILQYRGRQEDQRSSGFWIGPAAGSTAAQRSAGGKVLPLRSRKLQLVVREPYAPHGQKYRLLRVEVPQGAAIEARSKMQDCRVYLDGPYKQVSVRLGDVVRFQASEEPLRVYGLAERRRG